jgi:type I restriction enzyme S subunit
MDNLNTDILHKVELPVPPIVEQKEIVAFTDRDMETIDVAIDRIHDKIRLLHEYRTRMITDLVTGKVDVRHFKPGTVEPLPDGLESSDEADEHFEDEPQDATDLDPDEEVAHADD